MGQLTLALYGVPSMHGSCQFELLSLHFSSNRVKRRGMKQNGGAQDKGMQIPFLIRGKPLGMSYNVLYKCHFGWK